MLYIPWLKIYCKIFQLKSDFNLINYRKKIHFTKTYKSVHDEILNWNEENLRFIVLKKQTGLAWITKRFDWFEYFIGINLPNAF